MEPSRRSGLTLASLCKNSVVLKWWGGGGGGGGGEAGRGKRVLHTFVFPPLVLESFGLVTDYDFFAIHFPRFLVFDRLLPVEKDSKLLKILYKVL